MVVLAVLRLVLPGLRDRYDEHRFGMDRPIEGRHFLVFSELDRPSAEALADGLEAFYVAFHEVHGPSFDLPSPEGKGRVFVAADKETLVRMSLRELHDPMSNNGGLYHPDRREMWIVGTGDLESDLASACHEAVHMAFDIGLGPDLARLSPWLVEGLAVYFGDAAVRRPGGSFAWGEVPSRILEPLLVPTLRRVEGDDRPILPSVLAADEDRFTGEGNGAYYAISYLLVHHLLLGNDGAFRDRFESFYDLERRQGGPPHRPQLLFDALAVEPATLERDWRRHVRQLEGRD